MNTALITGAGRGLGRALAEQLARRGLRLVLVARTAEDLEATAAAVRAAGGAAQVLIADIGDPASAWSIAAQAHDYLGAIDLLVHDASTLGALPMPLLMDASPEDVERTFQVNVLGPFRLTKAVAGGMLLRGHGTVLAISSDAAVEAYGRWGAYGASKAALDHLLRIWAVELAGSGVRLASVDPGEMATRMHADAVPDADPATLADPTDVARRIVRLLFEPGRLPSGERARAAAVAP